MTIEAKPIATMFTLQFGAVIIFKLGGIVGQNVMRKLHEGYALPSLTHSCVSFGLWPLAIPFIWAIIAFTRANRDAPYLEMLIWFAFAIAFFVVVGGWGMLAAIVPFFTIVCN